MRNRKSGVRDSVLTVIWLITAALVLVLTVVYLERLQKLYTEVDQQNSTQTASASVIEKDGGTGTENTGTGNTAGSEAAAGNTDATDVNKNGTVGNDPPAGDQTGVADNDPAGAGTGTDDPDGAGNTDTNDANEADTDSGNVTGNTDNNGSTPGTAAGEDGNDGETTAADTSDGNGEGSGNTEDTAAIDADRTAQENNGNDAPESEEKAKAREKYDYSLGLDPEKPIIALSFDDGPSIYTGRVIAALQANHAEATFFMVGYNVREYKDTVRLVYDAGMEIGNHTTDHKKLTELSKADVKSEVFDNEDLINAVVPVGKVVVRPPYGSHNSTVRNVVSRPMFNWTVDSLDWKTRNADSIVAQIKQDARDGYIILMHDIYETTAEAAERIIPWLIDQGYQVTSVSKMFKARGEKTEDGQVYRNVEPAK